MTLHVHRQEAKGVSHQTRHNILKKIREIVEWQQKVKGKFRDGFFPRIFLNLYFQTTK
jgi:hypothetical protein